MINENTILESLRSGASVDDLAAEFTKALNAAKATHEEELKKQKENADKAYDTKELVEHVTNYMAKWYPEAMGDTDVETLVDPKYINEIINFFDEVAPLTSLLNTKPKKNHTFKIKTAVAPTEDFDPIAKFLKEYVC